MKGEKETPTGLAQPQGEAITSINRYHKDSNSKRNIKQVATFHRNATHPDIWDLQPNRGAKMPFTWFRLSEPRSPYLLQQGATKVAESFTGNEKVLHTGLRKTFAVNVVSGNIFDPKTKKRQLLLLRRDAENSITVFLFKNNPKDITPAVREVLS